MRISRRGFLAAAAATPLGAALVPWRLPTTTIAVTCALDESRAGYDRALVHPQARHLLVFPGAVGWDPLIASRVREGATVIFESAAGFGDAKAFGEQCAGLQSAFDLTIEPPAEPWPNATKPAYVDLLWPAAAKVRDFSSVVEVRGGETVGKLGPLPVAALRRSGAGALLFLGSPIGPALWTGDPEANSWLTAVLAATRPSAQ